MRTISHKRGKRLSKKDILVSKTFQGAYRCEAMVDGYREWHDYFYFTKKEAINDFYNRYA